MKLKKKIQRIFSVNKRKIDVKRIVSPFLEVGFHGDVYLMKIIDSIISNCKYFVETGTNVGSTLSYLARTYQQIECLSCEPDPMSYKEAKKNTSGLQNVSIYNETSQRFIKRMKKHHPGLIHENVLFWLDAHGYGFEWPLKEEIKFITEEFDSAYILIDDFKVPDFDCFKWDKYKEHECTFEYIEHSIKNDLKYHLYYPAYTDKTSEFHPLTGWGLIEFGQDSINNIFDHLKRIIRKEI